MASERGRALWLQTKKVKKKRGGKGRPVAHAFPEFRSCNPSQLVTLDMLREMQQDGHSIHVRRVAPADLSTGTRPWHLSAARPLPGVSRHHTMQVSQIDDACFPGPATHFHAFLRPPGTEKWIRPFPVLMRRVRGPCWDRGRARLEYDLPELARYRTPDS